MSIGYALGAAKPAGVAAQTPAAQVSSWGKVPLAPDQGRATHWSAEHLARVHSTLSGRANGRILSKPFDLIDLPFTRTHYFDVVHRPAATTPPTAEQHEGVTDVYLVFGGSGTVTVGGEIESRRVLPNRPGEFQGTLRGGDAYQVKAGDILAVPPNMAHATVSDSGGLTYMLLKINVGLYPWSAVAGVP